MNWERKSNNKQYRPGEERRGFGSNLPVFTVEAKKIDCLIQYFSALVYEAKMAYD